MNAGAALPRLAKFESTSRPAAQLRPAMRGIRGSAVGFGTVARSRAASASLTAQGREVGVATEILLTKVEQVSDDPGARRRITP
jgi:hypothetical protein